MTMIKNIIGQTHINSTRLKHTMGNKQKGSNYERELIHTFWAAGWAASRVAGSGSMHYPSPDIIASRNGTHFIIECKSTKQKYKYLKKEEIEHLTTYAQKAGGQPLVAIRFVKTPWLFFHPTQLKEKNTSFGITITHARMIGKTIEEIING